MVKNEFCEFRSMCPSAKLLWLSLISTKLLDVWVHIERKMSGHRMFCICWRIYAFCAFSKNRWENVPKLLKGQSLREAPKILCFWSSLKLAFLGLQLFCYKYYRNPMFVFWWNSRGVTTRWWRHSNEFWRVWSDRRQPSRLNRRQQLICGIWPSQCLTFI